ncbi:MAG TPA: regulatory protein RecX [Thermoanaerobaculia bacterium]|nr:regulatory protein RecX [Thermoanaerobaculia bacterium]
MADAEDPAEPRPPSTSRRGTGAARGPRPSSPEAAHRAALDLLARRSHFERELECKLERKGFAAGDVRGTLDRLRRAGLVDDRRCAAELIASRLRRSPQGARRLRAELARKGVAAETIESALAEALPGNEYSLARAAVRRFQRRRPGADPRALERYLDRMGFSSRDILALSEEPTDLEPPDHGG